MPVTVVDGEAVVGYDPRRLEQLLQRPQRPTLGVAVADAARMAARGRCSVTHGAYAGRVREGSAAARAGLREGDIIVSLAGHRVEDASDLEQIVPRLTTGQRVPLVYVRGERRRETTLRI
ncbi:MAG: PDZ domain-containing protein [Anaerolineales bacterium]